MTAIAILIVDFPPFGLLRVQSQFCIGFAPLHVAAAGDCQAKRADRGYSQPATASTLTCVIGVRMIGQSASPVLCFTDSHAASFVLHAPSDAALQ